jgi:hypothetical protein
MTVLEFFEYLAASEQTAELAEALFDVWAANEVAAAFAA